MTGVLGSDVLVVLPTYNEAANIETVLRRIRGAADVAVLVVDDASPDGTADLAERVAGEVGGVHVLRRPGKSGLGSAYRAGFGWGFEHGAEILVEMDADLSHDPDALPALIAAVRGGADLAIGSRYVPGGSIPDWSLHRRALSRGGNRYAARMLDLDVADSTSGFRAYRAWVLRGINLAAVRADGYGFQIEMTMRSVRGGAKVVEVPISFTERAQGTSKMSSRIVVEALFLVTAWGVKDRVRRVAGRVRSRSGRSTQQA